MTLKLFVPPQETEGNCGAAINTTGHSRPRPLAGSRSEPSVPTPRNAQQVPKPRDSAEGLTKGGTRTQLPPRPDASFQKGRSRIPAELSPALPGWPEKLPAARGSMRPSVAHGPWKSPGPGTWGQPARPLAGAEALRLSGEEGPGLGGGCGRGAVSYAWSRVSPFLLCPVHLVREVGSQTWRGPDVAGAVGRD